MYMLCDVFTCISQTIGVTTTIPDVVPDVLPDYDAGSHEWNYIGQSLWHNKKPTDFHHLPTLNDLKTQEQVSLMISTDGELHLYINKKHVQMVATGLPVNQAIWGAVDVYWRCAKIKSEMLSGELDVVYVRTCIIKNIGLYIYSIDTHIFFMSVIMLSIQLSVLT